DKSKEEYESDIETPEDESLFYYAEEAERIEKKIIKQVYEREFYFQENNKSEEIKKVVYNFGELKDNQVHVFTKFMKNYKNLFVWKPYKFGQTKVLSHAIQTDGPPIKQNFY
ncbi:10227_t:CDS:1, partial [Dentiscutata erythropus]